MHATRPTAGAPFDFESTLTKIARVITRQHGIAVVFGPGAPRLEAGRIIIPPIDLDSASAGADGAPAAAADSASRQDVLIGYLDLLAARSKHSSLADIDAWRQPLERRLAQTIDDRRACALLSADFPGARWFIEALRQHAAADAARRWPTLPWRERFLWLAECALWDSAPPSVDLGAPLRATLNQVRPALERARASQSTAHSIALARGILRDVRALGVAGVNNMMLASRPEDGDSPQPGGYEDDGAANLAPDDSETTGDASPSPPPRPGAGQESALAAGMGQAPFATQQSAANAPPGAAASDAEVLYQRPTLSVPLSTEFDTITDHTGHGDASAWQALRTQARAETGSLRAKLERALKADEWTRWQREQERGEIDRSALARLASSPGYRTPFQRRRAQPGRDTAITLLLDLSGSMAGDKIALARLCTAALADALGQLDFACEVLGYSSIEVAPLRALYQQELAAGTDLRPYNRFVEKLDLQIYKRFDSADPSGIAAIECGHENPDGECLAWAAARLAERSAERRILMVLADGYPATGEAHPAVLQSDLRERVAAIAHSGIELIGVGILDDAVEAFYPRSVVVRKLSELPTIAFNALGAMLLQRGAPSGVALPGRKR